MAEHVHKFEPVYEMRRGWALDCVHCPLRIPIERVNAHINATYRLRAGIDELKDACKDDPNEMGGPFVSLSWVERTLEGK